MQKVGCWGHSPQIQKVFYRNKNLKGNFKNSKFWVGLLGGICTPIPLIFAGLSREVQLLFICTRAVEL